MSKGLKMLGFVRRLSSKPVLTLDKVECRPAENTDVDGIMNLIAREVHGFSDNSKGEIGIAKSKRAIFEETFKQEFNTDAYFHVRLVAAGKDMGSDEKSPAPIYGYSTLRVKDLGSPEFSEDAMLKDTLVCREYRRIGIGSKLVQYALYASRKMNVNRVFIHVPSTDSLAQSFLKKNGFLMTKMTFGPGVFMCYKIQD